MFPLLQFSKETRQARWRAYAKGCVDVSETSSQKAMDGRAKLNDVAPKDVKQLEILKPINTPSMAERYKQALQKEKRLEAASRPAQKQTSKDGKKDEAENKKKQTKKKKKKEAAPRAQENAKALEQQDQVEEGINWSDDEE